jgi:hypothetical protein
MEIINQLAAPLAQSAQVARQQSSEKTQQIRRAQVSRKNVAALLDTFEHSVESAEATTPIHDEHRRQPTPQPRQSKRPCKTRPASDDADPPPTIDVTA